MIEARSAPFAQVVLLGFCWTGAASAADLVAHWTFDKDIDDSPVSNGALDEPAIQALLPTELTGLEIVDPSPENNIDPSAYTNQTSVLLRPDGLHDRGQATIEFALDADFRVQQVRRTWLPKSDGFPYDLPQGDGVKTVYARLEIKPGEFGPTVFGKTRLDTIPPSLESVRLESSAGKTNTTHVRLSVTATDIGEAATGVARSRFRDNRSSWTGWRDFLNTACFRLDPASGRHVVECEVCDAAGNVSPGQAAEPVVLDWMPSLGEHRNLFNGDFGVYFWKPEQLEPEGKPFTAGTIRRFVDLLAESGVDTYVMNPNSKVAWYPSKVWPTVLDGYVRDDPENKTGGGLFGPKLLNPMLDLQEAGVDVVAEATRHCRRRGISPWVSIRMNDPHGGASHLENRLSANPEYQAGTLLDYQHQEVRDFYLALIRELVENYDFDGLELDWKRSPACFPAPASQESIDTMTAWFGEIRELTQSKAERLGRPFYFGLHVQGNYKLLRDIGIDVEAICKAGMLDFLCVSNFMQTAWDMPHDRIRRELGSNLAIYGVTELWIQAAGRLVCDNPPALRGNAAGKLVLGAAGIEQYNYYWSDDYRKSFPAMHNLHDLASLRGQTKHYAFSIVGPFWSPPYDLVVQLPSTLEPTRRRTFRLPMCAEPSGRGLELIVQVVVEKTDGAQQIGVGINGRSPNYQARPTEELLFPTKPARHPSEHQAFNYRFSVDHIVDGWNEITLTNAGSEPIRMVGLELAVQQATDRKQSTDGATVRNPAEHVE